MEKATFKKPLTIILIILIIVLVAGIVTYWLGLSQARKIEKMLESGVLPTSGELSGQTEQQAKQFVRAGVVKSVEVEQNRLVMTPPYEEEEITVTIKENTSIVRIKLPEKISQNLEVVRVPIPLKDILPRDHILVRSNQNIAGQSQIEADAIEVYSQFGI